MKPVDIIAGVAAPMPRADIDTDAIFPQQWLITTERDGLGVGLFSNWRYREGTLEPDPDFVLNEQRFDGARIIVAGPNYGCGSSREHAVWAHLDYGIEAVVSSSFGPIFQDNALKNGLLTVEFDEQIVTRLLGQLAAGSSSWMRIDLRNNLLSFADQTYQFAFNAERKNALLEGRDEISTTLTYWDRISEFTRADRSRRPWMWPSEGGSQ